MFSHILFLRRNLSLPYTTDATAVPAIAPVEVLIFNTVLQNALLLAAFSLFILRCAPVQVFAC